MRQKNYYMKDVHWRSSLQLEKYPESFTPMEQNPFLRFSKYFLKLS